MKLKKDDRIRYEGSIYLVTAIVWSTVYLSAVNDNSTEYDYDIQEVYAYYKDIEFLGKERIFE